MTKLVPNISVNQRCYQRLSASMTLVALLLCLASTCYAATKPAVGGTRELDTTHSLANGLVECWLFNENSGSTAADSTSNDNDGTLVGDTSWVTGNFSGPALDFDGTGDYGLYRKTYSHLRGGN